MSNQKLSLQERLSAPTPGFFKKLRNIGLIITAVSTAILTAPVSLPAAVITVADYLTVAGGVLGAVSQATVEGE